MKIYRVRFNEQRYLAILVPSREMGKIFAKGMGLPRGNRIKDSWPENVDAELYNFVKDNKEGEIPDISFWDNELVLSPKAFDVLKTDLEPFCEFLALSIDDETWMIANVIHYFDEIDETESEANKQEGIKKLKFNNNKITNELVFRTHYGGKSTVFCTQKFADLVESNQLTGLIFQTDLAYYGPVELVEFYSK